MDLWDMWDMCLGSALCVPCLINRIADFLKYDVKSIYKMCVVFWVFLIATCNPSFPLLVFTPLIRIQNIVLCLESVCGLVENKLNVKWFQILKSS